MYAGDAYKNVVLFKFFVFNDKEQLSDTNYQKYLFSMNKRKKFIYENLYKHLKSWENIISTILF